ncbi:MAG: hypothetical protein ACW97X_09240 [Candidatus Hodarchaeales archaeon]|jgi:hypothetical protein
MGLEDNINAILQILKELQLSLQTGSDLQASVHNLNLMLLGVEEKFETSATNTNSKIDSISQIVESIKFDPELQSSIQQLPPLISTFEESLRSIQRTFESTTEETRNDLKFIKVSYVEDVVVNMRNLSQEITDMIKNSGNKTNQLYEASVTSFTPIQEKLDSIETSLNALIENQADQLTTVGELRDRVNAIIQVELASLRDRIVIYLESSVNELKTSVTERLASQDGSIQQLAATNRKLNQTVAALPEIIKAEIDAAVESKIIQELGSMNKQMRKMTAFIVRSQKDKPEE